MGQIKSQDLAWTIILVHGTWGRGYFASAKEQPCWCPDSLSTLPSSKKLRWFDSSSTFRNELDRHLDKAGMTAPDIRCFCWNGHNSIREREKAAEVLAGLISRILTEAPAKRVFVIGHSHGGNVALRALGKMTGDASGVRLISLATPFLCVTPPAIASIKADRLTMWFSLLCFIACLTYLFGIISLNSLAAATIAIISAILGSLSIQLWRAKLQGSGPSKKVSDLCDMTSFSDFNKKSIKLLVIRGVDDEASLAIGAGALANRLNRVVSDWSLSLLTAIPFLACPLLAIAALAIWFGLDITSNLVLSSILSWIFVIMDALLGLVAAGLIIAAASNCVYARELFLRFYNVEISVNSAPDAHSISRVATIIRGTSSTSKLRHFIYEELDCAKLITEWVVADNLINAEKGCSNP